MLSSPTSESPPLPVKMRLQRVQLGDPLLSTSRLHCNYKEQLRACVGAWVCACVLGAAGAGGRSKYGYVLCDPCVTPVHSTAAAVATGTALTLRESLLLAARLPPSCWPSCWTICAQARRRASQHSQVNSASAMQGLGEGRCGVMQWLMRGS
jgi:hypothetical protein